MCNFMLPLVAKHLQLEATNKEGWVSGLADAVLKRQDENAITLAVAFPMPGSLQRDKEDIYEELLTVDGKELACYGFYENTATPHVYDELLEGRLSKIIEAFRPDIVHCFGTEYPHTLAMCKVFPDKKRILIGIQGLCQVYANAYFANLPQKVVYDVTLRDFLKKDSLIEQQQKFAMRGIMEVEAIRLAGNVTGRTDWDKHYTQMWNPKAVYHKMNETLRPEFYTGSWEREQCIPHSIFVSQGDYPIKGLHYLLSALPVIRAKYPDVKVFVAGASSVNYKSLKDKLKISAYGRYLRHLIKSMHLQPHLEFVGRLQAQEMKQQYLKSSLFVCCSSIENSPNSLGEAMLLGMPCVSANVGGISSIFEDKEDGLLYQGYTVNKKIENSENNKRDFIKIQSEDYENIVNNLAKTILEIWENEEKILQYCKNARNHAKRTHNSEENYRKMTEIYAKVLLG